MRRNLLIMLAVASSWLMGASAAQAIVVDMNAIGPPSVAPNWFRCSAGFPVAGLKKPTAFKLVFLTNSQALP